MVRLIERPGPLFSGPTPSFCISYGASCIYKTCESSAQVVAKEGDVVALERAITIARENGWRPGTYRGIKGWICPIHKPETRKLLW